MTSYGYPPDERDCAPTPPPDNLLLVTSTRTVPPGAVGMRDWMRKPVSDEAIARQLNIAFEFGRDEPVAVKVPGRGTFLIGERGWCVK